MTIMEILRSWAVAALLMQLAAFASAARAAEDTGFAARFLNEAVQSSLAEITLGQMAEKRASSDGVRDFAARMIRDHSKALAQAEQLAREQGIEVDKQMGDMHQQIAESLANEPAEGFDGAYMQAMVRSHREAVSKFQEQAQGQEDPVTAYARQQLPVLREHLARAESVAGRL